MPPKKDNIEWKLAIQTTSSQAIDVDETTLLDGAFFNCTPNNSTLLVDGKFSKTSEVLEEFTINFCIDLFNPIEETYTEVKYEIQSVGDYAMAFNLCGRSGRVRVDNVDNATTKLYLAIVNNSVGNGIVTAMHTIAVTKPG